MGSINSKPITPIHCRSANVDEIYDLRCAILRPKQIPMQLHFDGDTAAPPNTWHFGAFTGNPERNVACLTLLASQWENKPALQLRGMAVADEVRGTGVGRQLLNAAHAAVQSDSTAGTWSWWCNARKEAIGFYEKLGWKVVSDEFMIQDVGPHRKMVHA